MRHLRYSFIVLALFMLPQLQGCAGKKKPTEVSTGALEPEDSNASKKTSIIHGNFRHKLRQNNFSI